MYDKVQNLIDPVPLNVDLKQLRKAIWAIGQVVDYDPNECLRNSYKQSTINFTYPKNIPQSVIDKFGDLKSKFIGPMTYGEGPVKQLYNIGTDEFTEMHPLVANSYIKTIFDQIQNYHISQFGSGAIRWVHSPSLAPSAGFYMHVDPHCTARYHIVLNTTDYSYMMVEQDNEIKTVHMPADGRVWFLDTNVPHNATNLTPVDQTINVRTHLIFSVYG
jgi:hypothetical protein